MICNEKIIEEPFLKYKLARYLERKLERAGLAAVEIQRTPMMTRITLEVLNPARIIGRQGRIINELSEEIKEIFKIENPQISVIEVQEQFLEPVIVGKRVAKHIEMGKKIRAVLHFMLKQIMSAGAIGAEIVAAGKIGAKGARSKRLRVMAGYIPKAGEPMKLVREALINANTKSGIIGVLVRIVPPGTVFPDKTPEKIPLPKVIEKAKELTRQ